MTKQVNQYISQALFLISFKTIEEKVRLRQADAERAFCSMFNVQSQQTNIPDTLDPNIARITFSTNHKSLNITQVGCQLDFAFERDGIAFEEQLATIRKNVNEFYRCVLAFKSAEDLGGMALILDINFPTSIGKTAMQQHLYDRFFVKRSEPGSLASLTFQIGYETMERYFLNFAANVYELRAMKFDPPVPGPAKINIQDVPLIEEGFGIKIDVNDKPRAMSGVYKIEPPDALISKTFEFVRSAGQEVLGLGD